MVQFDPLFHEAMSRIITAHSERTPTPVRLGLINEHQLVIAESTCPARTVGWPLSDPHGYNMFYVDELSKVALERCDNARCAIKTMGALAVEYGFWSSDAGDPSAPCYADTAEALAIGDKYGEVWMFNIITGANIIHSPKPNIQYSKVLYNTPHVTMSGISVLFIYDKQNYSLDVEYIMNCIVKIESKVINKYVNHIKCVKKNRAPVAKNNNNVSPLSIYSQLYELLSQWHHLNKKYIIFRINNIQHNVDNNTVGIVCQIY